MYTHGQTQYVQYALYKEIYEHMKYVQTMMS